jgi:hypothetical protein
MYMLASNWMKDSPIAFIWDQHGEAFSVRPCGGISIYASASCAVSEGLLGDVWF